MSESCADFEGGPHEPSQMTSTLGHHGSPPKQAITRALPVEAAPHPGWVSHKPGKCCGISQGAGE